MGVLLLGLAIFAYKILNYWNPQFLSKYLELYGNFHLDLNKSNDEPDTEIPPTQWMNMGYWRDTIAFPQACQNLAMKTIEAAHVVEDGRVLDVGHGSGDSLLLHINHPSVKKPKTLVGITSAKIQQEAAASRATAALRDDTIPHNQPHSDGTTLKLYLGDAVYRNTPPSPSGDLKQEDRHPLDPTNPDPPFTSIIAIDCAYHFHTRREFLQQCFQRLDTGGHIALADMCIVRPAGSGLFTSVLTRVILGALSAPSLNFCTPSEYEACLTEVGYADIHIEDITLDVFPRFVDFLTSKGTRKLGRAWWMMGKVFYLWWTVCGGRYVIVSAKKP